MTLRTGQASRSDPGGVDFPPRNVSSADEAPAVLSLADDVVVIAAVEPARAGKKALGHQLDRAVGLLALDDHVQRVVAVRVGVVAPEVGDLVHPAIDPERRAAV